MDELVTREPAAVVCRSHMDWRQLAPLQMHALGGKAVRKVAGDSGRFDPVRTGCNLLTAEVRPAVWSNPMWDHVSNSQAAVLPMAMAGVEAYQGWIASFHPARLAQISGLSA